MLLLGIRGLVRYGRKLAWGSEVALNLDPAVARFTKTCEDTKSWLGATEALWMTAPPATEVRVKLKVPQMEALYEAAFLRIFTAWETVLEDLVVRMMVRASTPSWVPRVPAGKTFHSTIKDARVALYGGRDFLLWHNPDLVVKRVGQMLSGSPLEAVILGASTPLQHIANVRHRIAHASDDAKKKFEDAAMYFAGSSFQGSPGRMLRAQDISDALNLTRWIRRISDQLDELLRDAIS